MYVYIALFLLAVCLSAIAATRHLRARDDTKALQAKSRFAKSIMLMLGDLGLSAEVVAPVKHMKLHMRESDQQGHLLYRSTSSPHGQP